MLGDSDDLGQLPHLHDTDDEELMALEGQLPGESDEDKILQHLRYADDDISDLKIVQGTSTNLDNMDKEQVLQMMQMEQDLGRGWRRPGQRK